METEISNLTWISCDQSVLADVVCGARAQSKCVTLSRHVR